MKSNRVVEKISELLSFIHETNKYKSCQRTLNNDNVTEKSSVVHHYHRSYFDYPLWYPSHTTVVNHNYSSEKSSGKWKGSDDGSDTDSDSKSGGHILLALFLFFIVMIGAVFVAAVDYKNAGYSSAIDGSLLMIEVRLEQTIYENDFASPKPFFRS